MVAVTLIIFGACPPTPAFTPFRIGTGGSTGVYYPVGKLIAAGLTLSAAKDSSALRGIIGVAQNSAGSIENLRAVIAGELAEAGLGRKIGGRGSQPRQVGRGILRLAHVGKPIV